MKKTIIFVLSFLFLASFLFGDVFMTELADPNNNLNARYIELYNTGATAVDFTEGTGWRIDKYTNASATVSYTINLTGTIAANDFYIIAYDYVAGTFLSVYGFAADQLDAVSNGVAGANGDDPFELVDGTGTVVDQYGIPGTDGTGFSQEYEDGRAERVGTVVTGQSTYVDANWNTWSDGPGGDIQVTQDAPGDFDPRAWIGTGGNLLPSITNIVHTPSAPSATDDVTISADVTDSDGTIASVVLNWSIDDITYSSDINMALGTTPNYIADSYISAQTAGTTVYYKITATDDEPESVTSPTQTYIIPTEYTIYEIQGQLATSPYEGSQIITSGIVTAVFDDYIVIQDGTTAWNGIWLRSTASVLLGDNISVSGLVYEDYNYGDTGNTIIGDCDILINSNGISIPNAIVLTTAEVPDEQYEGMLVTVDDAQCTNADLGYGAWEVNDGSGACRVSDIGYSYSPLLGTLYNVTGILGYSYSEYNIEPRDLNDVVVLGDTNPPEIANVIASNISTVQVTFSEYVDETTSENTGNYSIASRLVTVNNAVRNTPDSTQVTLTVSGMIEGDYTLTVINVEDLSENAIISENMNFNYTTPPETGDVVINEIGEPYTMPHTWQSSYVELYNTTGSDIDISGWIVHSIEVSRASASFTFPAGTTISAEGYIIATRERDNFLADYGTYVDESIVPVAAATTGTAVYIKNGYYFALEMSNGTILESTSSTVGWNSEVYERAYADSAANNDDNWYLTYQSSPVEGTPGAANSQGTPDAPINIVITHDGANVTVTWDVVIGASYIMYVSSDPYAADPWSVGVGTFDLSTDPLRPTWKETTTTETKYFYKVTATN